MLRSLRSLEGFRVHAVDGEVGRVADFFFEDETWTIRYLVVRTGNWLSGREVLVSPYALSRVHEEGSAITVSLTREQVQACPPIDVDEPVSRRHERALHQHYGWPYYWGMGGIWGPWAYPAAMAGMPLPPAEPMDARHLEEERGGDPHLRSVREVINYRIHAEDEEFGRVDDFLLDDASWRLRYLVLDFGSVLKGRRSLLSPEWVDEVRWDDRSVHVALPAEKIRTSPQWKVDSDVTRDYEDALHAHYGRPRYWDTERASGLPASADPAR
jgi:hypothetical protein